MQRLMRIVGTGHAALVLGLTVRMQSLADAGSNGRVRPACAWHRFTWPRSKRPSNSVKPDLDTTKEGLPMNRAIAVALVMCLAASAYGAVGDLTPRACDPNEIGGGWPASMAGGQDVKAAPAGCGTVHAAAKVITLRGYGPPVAVALDAAKADDKFLNVVRIDVDGTGKFTAEASIPITWPAADGTGAASIGPATLTLVRDGRKVPVSVRGYATSNGAGLASLYLVFGTCLEGPVRVRRQGPHGAFRRRYGQLPVRRCDEGDAEGRRLERHGPLR